MLFSYVKIPATHYALHFQQGRIRHEGPGLSFFYYAPSATIVSVPIGSTDALFAFVESSADFQSVTVQGQLNYRVVDPKKVASLLDFSLGKNGQYLGDGPQKLQERLVKSAQVAAKAVTQRMGLREVLTSSTAIGTEVEDALRNSEAITSLGVEILDLAVISMKPTPEMAEALEAEAREELQRKSDEAIYARRNAAVEQERRIKESELNTEIAVEEKKRQIREAQMAADIAIEEQRAQLVDQKVANERKDADSRAYALDKTIKAIETADWKKLMLLSSGGFDARQMIAMAFQELAGNAQKIGELNISPDLLQGLIGKTRS
jgi:regulator of protease activity HflC (stomatin/prohibitin superfamily)